MAVPTIARVKALWDYQAGAPTDLSLRAGQIVSVTRKVDANWWEGEVDGKIGIFPVQYVQELPQDASPALPPRPSVAGSAAPPSPASAQPVCLTCNKPITGDVLKWQSQTYHSASCLCCKKCSVQLGTESVIKKVGTEPHCKACFNELMFGPPKVPTSSSTNSSARPIPQPRALPQPTATPSPPIHARAVSAPVIAPPSIHVEAAPPLPSRQSQIGSGISHRPAPPVPTAAPAIAYPPQPPQPSEAVSPPVPQRPGSQLAHRSPLATPVSPSSSAEAASPPLAPYNSRPTYNGAPAAADPPPAPYATRPTYNGAPAVSQPQYASPPPAAAGPPHTQNGMLMAHPTGVIAHPNKAAPLSPRAAPDPNSNAYQPVLKAGEAYIPPPPAPFVPTIIPPVNPYSTNKKVKVVIVGDPGVGKTAFMHAAISGVFYQAYQPSQEGGLFHVMIFTDNGKTPIDLELYDTPGDFYTNPGYRHGLLGVADVIVVMFDQLNRATFENAERLWYAEIRDKFFTLKPLVIIATKKDAVTSQSRYDPNFVRHQECLDFAQRVDAAKFVDTSAQKNIMLRETLDKVAKLGSAPLSMVKSNKRVERVQTEKKKEGKKSIFGSVVDHVKYGM